MQRLIRHASESQSLLATPISPRSYGVDLFDSPGGIANSMPASLANRLIHLSPYNNTLYILAH